MSGRACRSQQQQQWLLLLLLLRSSPLVAAGGGAEVWHEHEYEYNYVEMLILIILVTLALVFDRVWHYLVHHARHTYRYGHLHELATIGRQSSSRRARLEAGARHVHHARLVKELVNRAGSEFMTLGFLASCVFGFDSAGGFKLLAQKFPSTHKIRMPETKDDWLHMVELVHMKLFLGMVCYFFLIANVVRGSLGHIRSWEQMRLRRVKQEDRDPAAPPVPAPPGWGIHAADNELATYLEWRRYFIAKLMSWEFKRPKLFRNLLTNLGIDRSDRDVIARFQQEVEERFAFSAYLALNVECGVRDSIEIHQLTWMVLILLFGFFALLNRFAKISLTALMPVFIGVAFLTLAAMKLTMRHRRRSISCATSRLESVQASTFEVQVDRESAQELGIDIDASTQMVRSITPEGTIADMNRRDPAHAIRVGDRVVQVTGESNEDLAVENLTQESRLSILLRRSNSADDIVPCYQRYQTEMVVLRLLQVFLFLISYVFATTVLELHEWQEIPLTMGLYTSLFGLLFALLTYFLPSQVPLFLGLMALPPFMDDANVEAFFTLLLDTGSREALLRASIRKSLSNGYVENERSLETISSVNSREGQISEVLQKVSELEQRLREVEAAGRGDIQRVDSDECHFEDLFEVQVPCEQRRSASSGSDTSTKVSRVTTL